MRFGIRGIVGELQRNGVVEDERGSQSQMLRVEHGIERRRPLVIRDVRDLRHEEPSLSPNEVWPLVQCADFARTGILREAGSGELGAAESRECHKCIPGRQDKTLALRAPAHEHDFFTIRQERA